MTALVVATLLLIAVLGVSGIAKLRTPVVDAAAAFTSLRVPAALSRPWMVKALPWGELALALALLVLPGPALVAAAGAAWTLFAAYWVLIFRAVRSPAPADCGCFGALAPSRVTGVSLARNTALLAVAVLAVVDAVVGGWVPPRLLGESASWVAMAALAAAVVGLTLYEPPKVAPPASPGDASADGTDVLDDYLRSPIPFARLRELDGGDRHLLELARTRPVLLLFVSLTCGSCRAVMDRIGEWRTKMPMVDVRAVIDGGADQAAVPPAVIPFTLVDPGSEASRLFQMNGRPGAVLLGADGLLAGGPVLGQNAIFELVDDMIVQLGALDETSAGADSGQDGLSPAKLPESAMR